MHCNYVSYYIVIYNDYIICKNLKKNVKVLNLLDAFRYLSPALQLLNDTDLPKLTGTKEIKRK